MHRATHDLPGCVMRLNRKTERLAEQFDETFELWKDARAQAFDKQHASEIRPVVGQVTVAMAQTTEVFDTLAKQLLDPDKS